MNAGRTMDALIAEKVMGIKIPKDADIQYLETCIDLPHYSTDIAAAWGVVEKLKECFEIEINTSHGWGRCVSVSIEQDPWKDLGPLYVCNIRFSRAPDSKDELEWYSGSSNDAPSAICIAALRVLGIEV